MPYLETDEFRDVEASLEIVLMALRAGPSISKLSKVKSCILGLHNAFSSASVAVLTRTDGGGALDAQSEKRLLKYHNYQTNKALPAGARKALPEADAQYPTIRVESLMGLLKRLPEGLQMDIPKTWNNNLSGRDRSVFLLLSFRNEFVHFPPMSWSIEDSGLERIFRDCLEICRALIERGPLHRSNRFPDTSALETCDACLSELTGST